jgi:ABC-type iron transport system FetAB ATPase subunit
MIAKSCCKINLTFENITKQKRKMNLQIRYHFLESCQRDCSFIKQPHSQFSGTEKQTIAIYVTHITWELLYLPLYQQFN